MSDTQNTGTENGGTGNTEPVITERTAERVTERMAGRVGETEPRASSFTDIEAANREIARLRGENAQRRTENKDLSDRVGGLEQAQQRLERLEAAQAAGVSAEQLAAAEALSSATTADEIKAAQERLNRAVAASQTATQQQRNALPPRGPTQPLSRDQQIADAASKGNMREVERLNADKLAELGGD